jgi:outer membrane receptor protein involved in Fe transport
MPDHPILRRRRARFLARGCISLGAGMGLSLMLPSLSAAEAAARGFDIPAGDAAITLRQFATQAGVQLLYSPDDVGGVATQAVRGEFPPFTALQRMLDRTPLQARQDEKTKAIAISASKSPRGPPAPARPPDPSRPSLPQQTESPPVKKHSFMAAFGGWLAAVAATGAQTHATPSNEEPVTLSPFTVSTDRDNGFVAASSLAGGRLALDLKDTPVAYSVITSEFIAALGITDLSQAAEWTTNVNPNVNVSGGGFSDDGFGIPVSYSVRGAGVSGTGQGRQSRNFFLYSAPMDSYSVERFDFGRGPNSILFGNGTLGGLSSTMTKIARVGQRFGSISQTLGSWRRSRSTIDANVPLGDRLAVRAAAVYADRDDWRQRGFDKTRAAFLTSTFKVARDTVIRLEGEYGEGARSNPFTNISDQFSGWDGVTTFSGPLTTLPADANARGITRRAASPVLDPFSGVNAIMNYQFEPVTLPGGANAQVPIAGMTSGSLPTFNTANANLLYSIHVPADRFANAIAGSSFRMPSERFTLSRDTPLFQQRYADVQLTADHRIGEVFLQAGIDMNQTTQETHTLEARGATQVYIDINRVLPNGAPNPHFLEPYTDGNIRKGVGRKDGVGYRVAAAYVKDAGKWGHYSTTLLGGITETYDAGTAMNLTIAQSADHRAWGVNATDAIRLRSYLNDASRPWPTPTSIRYIDPVNGVDKTISPFWAIENNRPDSVNQIKTRYRYAIASVNAKYWENRVVLLGAVRVDKFSSSIRQQVLQGDYSADGWDGRTRIMKPNSPSDYGQLTYVPKDASGQPTGPALPADTRPRAGNGDRLAQYAGDRFRDDYNPPAIDENKVTRSLGTVVHVTKWLSPYFNYAETFNPPQAIQRFNSAFLPPTVAKGVDVGLRLSLFQNRLSLSAASYRNSEVNNAFDPGIQTNINTIVRTRPVGSTSAADINRRGIPFVPAVLRDVRDRQAEGYEFEITANPRKGWRLTGNVGLPKVYESNSYQDSKAYLEANLGSLKQVVIDAGGVVSGDDVASVDTSIPPDVRSPDLNGAITAYNNLIAAKKNFIDGKRIIQNQPNFNLYSDYSFQGGILKGLRLGAGVQYRGKAIIGNRGADTIVNPANAQTAIDDPAVNAYTPVYALRSTYNVVGTIGYTVYLKERRQLVFDVRIDNLLDQRGPIYSTTVLRPKGGDYASPARETVPNLYALIQPIGFQLTTTLKF